MRLTVRRRAAYAALVTGVVVVVWGALVAPARAQQYFVYWSEFGQAPAVGRVTLSGPIKVITRPQAGEVFGMEVVPATGHSYWIDRTTNSIQRADLDLLGQTPWSTVDAGNKLNLALDPAADLLFYTNSSESRIGRVRLSDGSFLGTFTRPGGSGMFPDDITVDPAAQRLYWSEQRGGVFSANYDGSGITEVFSTGTQLGDGASGIDYDPVTGKLYLALPNQNRILRVNPDGTQPETLLTLPNHHRPFGMDVAAGRIFWADLDNGLVWTATVTGGNMFSVVGGGGESPRQVFVTTIPEPAALAGAGAALLTLRRPRGARRRAGRINGGSAAGR